MKGQRKYSFSWSVVGENLDEARPSLGANTRVEVYRLLQYTLRDVLEAEYGQQKTDELFRSAGALAGKEFYAKYCSDVGDVNSLVRVVEEKFRELGMGIFRIESMDPDSLEITLNIAEDLDCSGLPDTQEQICVYDEGFIQGIFEAHTGEKFAAREIDCWCTGARTCRFNARKAE